MKIKCLICGDYMVNPFEKNVWECHRDRKRDSCRNHIKIEE